MQEKEKDVEDSRLNSTISLKPLRCWYTEAVIRKRCKAPFEKGVTGISKAAGQSYFSQATISCSSASSLSCACSTNRAMLRSMPSRVA